jgi:mitofilin
MVALHESRYRDFFIESVPLGESIMDYAEARRWDEVPLTTLPKKALDATKGAYRSLAGAVTRTLGTSPSAQSRSLPDSAKETVRVTTDKTKGAVTSGVTFIQKRVEETEATAAGVAEGAKVKALKFPKDVQSLVEEAEKALAGVPSSKPSSSIEPAEVSVQPPQFDKAVYTAALPIGFEPPPGFTRPKPTKDAKSASLPPLPLVAPAVKGLSASEPVIAQIASSIDGLATLLKDSPTSSAGAKDILDSAQHDLVELGSRINAIKREEKEKLETQLEEQAKEYSTQILQLEVDAQDKIDAQEEGFKVMLEDERQKILDLYRQKLAHELETQSEIINQRSVELFLLVMIRR